MERQRRDRQKDIVLCIFLVIIFFGLLYITVPKGDIYGSTTDWLSQHTTLAETLRDEMLEKGTLFPDFIWLGGGNNIYNFSYYGYLRPDVILGCLLPQVSMEWILIGMMVVSFLVTVLLCYIWLRMNALNPGTAFLGSFFCMTAACFFHFHRQIMFINYMPLLFLALMLTEWTIKKRNMLIYCMILAGICFQSYYYSISCFIVICIYWYLKTKDWKDWLFLIKMLAFSVGISCILLLPTFLALLENKRASGGIDMKSLLLPKLQLKGLLYSPYGIGFSMIILYLLAAGLLHKRYCRGSIGCICLFCFPVIPYVLNGTLYARYKILMPFLPLILLHCMKVMRGIWKEEIKPSSRLAFGMLLIGVAGLLMEENGKIEASFLLIIADMVLILLFSWLWKWKNKAVVYLVLLVMPVIGTVVLSSQEEFVSEKTRNLDAFTGKEVKSIAKEEWARTDYLSQPLMHVNQIQYSTQKTTGMYSSVTNKRYAAFYYDIMHTPVRINNRVALLPEVNPFLQYLMGVRYIVTDFPKLPHGYTVIKEKDKSIIAENEKVLPIAYLSTKRMDKETFDSLEFPYTLEAMLEYTIVEDTENTVRDHEKISEKKVLEDKEINGKSNMEKKKFRYRLLKRSDDIAWKKKKDGMEIHAKKNSTCSIRLKESLDDKIGILSFDVENESGKAVMITMNGMRNKLSGKGAPYPNENTRFTFYLDENMDDTLNVDIAKGKFRITNVTYYVFPRSCMDKKDMIPVSFHKAKKQEVLHCKAEAATDSFFVTSVPYQKGIRVLVDGSPAEPVLVNTAFLGVEIGAGEHDIEVLFTPPGKRIGLLISALSFALILLSDLRKYYREVFLEHKMK